MKSIRGSRIVVVAESDHRHILAGRLRRTEVTGDKGDRSRGGKTFMSGGGCRCLPGGS
jgi:hypothetical protein